MTTEKPCKIKCCEEPRYHGHLCEGHHRDYMRDYMHKRRVKNATPLTFECENGYKMKAISFSDGRLGECKDGVKIDLAKGNEFGSILLPTEKANEFGLWLCAITSRKTKQKVKEK